MNRRQPRTRHLQQVRSHCRTRDRASDDCLIRTGTRPRTSKRIFINAPVNADQVAGLNSIFIERFHCTYNRFCVKWHHRPGDTSLGDCLQPETGEHGHQGVDQDGLALTRRFGVTAKVSDLLIVLGIRRVDPGRYEESEVLSLVDLGIVT
jgi:hypothetical protein